MKKTLSIVALLAMQFAASAQTTVMFKPDPSLGDNTSIMTTYGCTLVGRPAPSEFMNAGTTIELPYMDWTFNAGGCPHGTVRSLIRFNELSTIPAGATILYAQLNLFGVPSSSNYGNSVYPGSPLTLPNDGLVRQVTSPWNINTVTWNSQPSAPAGGAVMIPQSTSQWNYNASMNVTGMVQNMVSSGNNFGFMTTLQTEAYYRSVLFAGNGNKDYKLWPELIVTYCDPSFTYCFNSANPYLLTLNANTVNPGSNYEWYVDGNFVGNGANLTYWTGGPGTYKVCMRTYNKETDGQCESCMTVCVADNGKPQEPHFPDSRKEVNPDVIRGDWPAGDIPVIQTGRIAPNPTQKGWNISIDNDAAGNAKAEITLYDMTGKVLQKQSKTLNAGKNIIYQNAANLAPGTYMIEYTNGKTSWKEKAVKE